MTRNQIQDELCALIIAADGVRRWETALPARSADHAARRETARRNILAEFDRMRQVYDAAISYLRSVDGPAVVDATTFARALESSRVLKEAREVCHEALLRASRDAAKGCIQ